MVQLEVVAHFRLRLQQRMAQLRRRKPSGLMKQLGKLVTRIQIREVRERVQSFELVPRIQPARQQSGYLALNELEPVSENEIPRHKQVNEYRQNRIRAQSERGSEPTQASDLMRRLFAFLCERRTNPRQPRRVFVTARFEVTKYNLKMSQRFFQFLQLAPRGRDARLIQDHRARINHEREGPKRRDQMKTRKHDAGYVQRGKRREIHDCREQRILPLITRDPFDENF